MVITVISWQIRKHNKPQVRWNCQYDTITPNPHQHYSELVVQRVGSVVLMVRMENKAHTAELQQVEDDDGAGDKQGLTGLDTIDAR